MNFTRFSYFVLAGLVLLGGQIGSARQALARPVTSQSTPAAQATTYCPFMGNYHAIVQFAGMQVKKSPPPGFLIHSMTIGSDGMVGVDLEANQGVDCPFNISGALLGGIIDPRTNTVVLREVDNGSVPNHVLVVGIALKVVPSKKGLMIKTSNAAVYYSPTADGTLVQYPITFVANRL